MSCCHLASTLDLVRKKTAMAAALLGFSSCLLFSLHVEQLVDVTLRYFVFNADEKMQNVRLQILKSPMMCINCCILFLFLFLLLFPDPESTFNC